MKPGFVLAAAVSSFLAACSGAAESKPRATPTPSASASAERELPDPIEETRPLLGEPGAYRAVTVLSDGGELVTEASYDLATSLLEVTQRAPDLTGEVHDVYSLLVGGTYYTSLRDVAPSLERCWLASRIPKTSVRYVAGLEVLGDVRRAADPGEDPTSISVEVVADHAMDVVAPEILLEHDSLAPVRIPATAVIGGGRLESLTYELGDAVDALEESGLDLRADVEKAFGNDSPGRVFVTYRELRRTLDLEAPDERFVAQLDDDRPATAPECADVL